MKTNSVRYKGVKNLSNYENATIERVIEISEDEDVKESTQELMKTVDGLLGISEKQEKEVVKPVSSQSVEDF